jgi:hypothetical protein
MFSKIQTARAAGFSPEIAIGGLARQAHAAPINQSLAVRVDHVITQVMRTIRNRMPLDILFTPELKLDLGVFIKDQALMFRLAQFLATFKLEVGSGAAFSGAGVTASFEGSELLNELKTILGTDAPAYLPLFYEACVDVLNGAVTTTFMDASLQGRIYTLKNALIAQVAPEKIQKSQAQQKIAIQDVKKIVAEGSAFLRESLGLYLGIILTGGRPLAFKDELHRTTQLLLPFVTQATSRYLAESMKPVPKDVLTFRDPLGYNRHGMLVATLIQVCLKALGYEAKLMVRLDLEPKVTLATSHAIVMVVSEEGNRYMIDGAYRQFHQDICIESAMLPTDPVLVLAEEEVEGYIDATVMTHWRSTFSLYKANDRAVISRLKSQDQILAYAIDQIPLPNDIIPADTAVWIRKSMLRVWGLEGYRPPIFNLSFQEIVHDYNHDCKTHAWLKPLGLAALTESLSVVEVESRLKLLLSNPSLRGQNTSEALGLVAQLPKEKRLQYAPLLDCDSRLHRNDTLDVSLNAYFRALRKIVNPEHSELRGVYGCSGADCTTILLATDATDLMFIDMTALEIADFKEALKLLQNHNLKAKLLVEERVNQHHFKMTRCRYGGASSSCDSAGRHKMPDLALKLFYNMRDLGVDLESVELSTVNGAICVEFPWAYNPDAPLRPRKFTFVTGDITHPELYPEVLRVFLREGIDLFYMKASFNVPMQYPKFLPYIGSVLREGGWLMTSDKTFTMENVDPTPCFEASEATFVRRSSDEVQRLIEVLEPPFDPLVSIPILEVFPPNRRASRTPGSDLTYWAILNLRQKCLK